MYCIRVIFETSNIWSFQIFALSVYNLAPSILKFPNCLQNIYNKLKLLLKVFTKNWDNFWTSFASLKLLQHLFRFFRDQISTWISTQHLFRFIETRENKLKLNIRCRLLVLVWFLVTDLYRQFWNRFKTMLKMELDVLWSRQWSQHPVKNYRLYHHSCMSI
jgi:hypothetical protein